MPRPARKPTGKINRPKKSANIAVMGCTGAGKTTFINLASNSDFQVGLGLESCTDTIQTSKPFVLNDVEVTLVDTPGLDDTKKDDAEILATMCDYLSSEYRNRRMLNGVIYLHRISDARMTGSASRNLRFFHLLCGDDALKNCAIVTNMWNAAAPQVAEERERELRSNFFAPILNHGATLLRNYNTIQSAQNIISNLIQKTPFPLAIQRELVDDRKHVYETLAGQLLLGEIAEQEKKYQAEMEILEQEMAEATAEHDEESRMQVEEAKREVLEVWKQLEEVRRRILNPSSSNGRTPSPHLEEKEHFDEEFARAQEAERIAKEQQKIQEEMKAVLTAKYIQTKRESETFQKRLQDEVDKAEKDRERMSRQYWEEKKRSDEQLARIRQDLEVERRTKEEQQKIQEQMKTALGVKDQEARRELEEYRKELRDEKEKAEKDRERLIKEYLEDKKCSDERLTQMRQDLEVERRAKEEQQQIREQMKTALAAKDIEMKKLQDEIEKIGKDRERMSKKYLEEKKHSDEQLAQIRQGLESERRAKEEQQKIQEQMKIALATENVEISQESEACRKQLQDEMEKAQRDRECASRQYSEEKKYFDEKLAQTRQDLEEERRAKEEQQRELETLKHELATNIKMFAEVQEELKRQIASLQRRKGFFECLWDAASSLVMGHF